MSNSNPLGTHLIVLPGKFGVTANANAIFTPKDMIRFAGLTVATNMPADEANNILYSPCKVIAQKHNKMYFNRMNLT